VAESDRRPGESDRDRDRRLAEMAARKKRERRDQGIQDSLDAQAEAAEIREALGDEVWLADITKDLFGMTPDEVDAAMLAGTKSSNWDAKDQAAMDAYDRAKKPRVFEGKKGRNRRVAKHLRQNKGKIEKAAKKGKSGCAWAFALLAVAGGGALYGIFEAGSAVVSALGH
jgi:hypothetical protein